MPTPLDRASWLPYFRAIADRLELRDWRIVIYPIAPEDDDMAQVADTRGMKHASVFLSDKFLSDTEDEQRYYAVHEMVHLFDAVECQFLNDVLTAEHYRTYELLHEYLIDGFAHAIAPSMPLPSEILPAAEES